MHKLAAKPVKWALILLLLALSASVLAAGWRKLDNDGIHDPANPALKLLQDPEEALSVLPPDTSGNKVDWNKALQDGDIKPRSRISTELDEEILDLDVLMLGSGAGSLPFVRFPHKPHTQWLDCANCHEHLFKSEAGATQFTMLDILNGEFCGTCHGAVAFPLTECNRCHSVLQDEVLRIRRKEAALEEN